MKHTSYIRITFSSACLGIGFLLNGCSIFGPVGHAISQGYENSVSYFNGYYNAKWLFDEAEDQIQSDALAKRGQQIQPGLENQIPSEAKEKLLKVIDKCSNILAFHSTSTLVDDALLLIGKSFYYQAEYLKAERKFAELIAQYPNSSLILETQIWYARTERKLEKTKEGIRICKSTIDAAQSSRENGIEMQAHQILGRLYLHDQQIDEAASEFEKEITLSNDNHSKAEALIDLGGVYFSELQYEKAADTYLRVGEYTSDIYLNYYSKMQAALAYREIKEYVKGLTLLDKMIGNFRYKSYLPNLLFERAYTYAASGKTRQAIDEYITIDTTYTKSESAFQSAYQLGILEEKELGDYQLALKYYAEVNLAPKFNFTSDGRMKYAALTRYFEAQKKLNIADSLMVVLADTVQRRNADSLSAILSDTAKYIGMGVQTPLHLSMKSTVPTESDSIRLRNQAVASQLTKSRFDSLKMLHALLDSTQSTIERVSSRRSRITPESLTMLKSSADSIQQKISLISSQLALSGADTVLYNKMQTISQFVHISADSLNVLKSVAAQDLGDVFYTELVVPDSAFYWYLKSLAWNYSSLRSPRILFILAELSRTKKDVKFYTPEEYYTRLEHDFPESIYADEARRFLGKENYVTKIDSAVIYYEQAEKYIDIKQYTNAIKRFRSIAKAFPKSPLAAKSEYAVGWIYENYFAQQDSALAQYVRVVKNYSGTQYSTAAANRLARIEPAPNMNSDTSKTHPLGIDSTKINNAKMDTIKAGGNKTDTLKTALLDTMKSHIMKSDTFKIKTATIDTAEINSGPVNQRILDPAGTRKDSVVSRRRLLE
jgi:tetratricopeptide (TPR) repeat protein